MHSEKGICKCLFVCLFTSPMRLFMPQAMTDVVGNPEEERRADFFHLPWSQEAVCRYFYGKVRKHECHSCEGTCTVDLPLGAVSLGNPHFQRWGAVREDANLVCVRACVRERLKNKWTLQRWHGKDAMYSGSCTAALISILNEYCRGVGHLARQQLRTSHF